MNMALSICCCTSLHLHDKGLSTFPTFFSPSVFHYSQRSFLIFLPLIYFKLLSLLFFAVKSRNHSVSVSTNKCLQTVKNLVHSTGILSIATPPHESLQKGNWVKLICGASFEVFPKIPYFYLYNSKKKIK